MRTVAMMGGMRTGIVILSLAIGCAQSPKKFVAESPADANSTVYIHAPADIVAAGKPQERFELFVDGQLVWAETIKHLDEDIRLFPAPTYGFPRLKFAPGRHTFALRAGSKLYLAEFKYTPGVAAVAVYCQRGQIRVDRAVFAGE